MRMILKDGYPASVRHIPVGNIEIDFETGEISGDKGMVERIMIFINDDEADGFYSEHSQSPSYELKNPLTNKSEFKAILSCLGLFSDSLKDVDMPDSTWDNQDETYDIERVY